MCWWPYSVGGYDHNIDCTRDVVTVRWIVNGIGEDVESCQTDDVIVASLIVTGTGL